MVVGARAVTVCLMGLAGLRLSEFSLPLGIGLGPFGGRVGAGGALHFGPRCSSDAGAGDAVEHDVGQCAQRPLGARGGCGFAGGHTNRYRAPIARLGFDPRGCAAVGEDDTALRPGTGCSAGYPRCFAESGKRQRAGAWQRWHVARLREEGGE